MTRNAKLIAAPFALLASLLLCDCAAPTPYTQLDWNGINESYPHHHREIARADSRTYVYRGDDAVYHDDYHGSVSSRILPTPRPSPESPRSDVVQDTQYGGTPIAGAPRFAWPVTGHVISNFGSTESGERNDGINIATRLDEPIHAAASGTITYEGNELKGYGNLILIRHADGYVTAYAHASKILVARGDFVAKGQVIGYAGETGDVTTPQLHFEIRHDTLPVNPRPLLVASR